MCLGVDGISTFSGARFEITILMRTQQTPYFIGIHNMAHWTNLVVKSLFSMLMVSKLEDLLKSLYGHFFSSPKWPLEFTKLAKTMKITRLKVLHNVEKGGSWYWRLWKWLEKRKTLIAKMVAYCGTKEVTKANLMNLCDGIILGLHVFYMLESVNALMKFVQTNDVFICDYIVAIKIYQANPYKMYSDPTTSF